MSRVELIMPTSPNSAHELTTELARDKPQLYELLKRCSGLRGLFDPYSSEYKSCPPAARREFLQKTTRLDGNHISLERLHACFIDLMVKGYTYHPLEAEYSWHQSFELLLREVLS